MVCMRGFWYSGNAHVVSHDTWHTAWLKLDLWPPTADTATTKLLGSFAAFPTEKMVLQYEWGNFVERPWKGRSLGCWLKLLCPSIHFALVLRLLKDALQGENVHFAVLQRYIWTVCENEKTCFSWNAFFVFLLWKYQFSWNRNT